jgi:hypothetical protein
LMSNLGNLKQSFKTKLVGVLILHCPWGITVYGRQQLLFPCTLTPPTLFQYEMHSGWQPRFDTVQTTNVIWTWYLIHTLWNYCKIVNSYSTLGRTTMRGRILEQKFEVITGGCRKGHEVLHNLYLSPKIVRVTKSQRMR